MSTDDVLGAVALLNPRTMERARRLALAVSLLRSGLDRTDAVVIVRQRCSCDRTTAWRVVSMAADMASPIEQRAVA